MMTSSVRNIFKVPELRRRILITLGLLIVFRIGCYVTVPGVNTEAVSDMIRAAQEGAGPFGALFGMMNLFTGAAFQRLALFGLGVMPYISASIIIQLLTTSVPYLEALAKEGEAGRKKIRRIERYVTVGLCLFQGYVMVKFVETWTGQTAGGQSIVSPYVSPMVFEIMSVLGLTAGSIFLMWIGEQMTEYGIGNGISLIIMAGIVARAPVAIGEVLRDVDWKFEAAAGKTSLITIILLLLLFVFIVVGVVLITQAQRRIPMQQAKQTRGRRVFGGQRHYMPLRVNQAGVIPIIFASSLLVFPSMIVRSLARSFPTLGAWLQPIAGTGFVYISMYAALIIFFCFFWTAVTFNPQQMSENLRDYGSFVPGIRPGRRTAEYLEKVMMRITMAGATFLAVIAVVPVVLSNFTGFKWTVTGFFGGTGLLIVVGVALDLVERIETHLLMRHYEGFMRKGRIRGRQ